MPKIEVWKSKEERQEWMGVCSCGKAWMFHFFGATLGFGLEHLRRHLA